MQDGNCRGLCSLVRFILKSKCASTIFIFLRLVSCFTILTSKMYERLDQHFCSEHSRKVRIALVPTTLTFVFLALTLLYFLYMLSCAVLYIIFILDLLDFWLVF